MPTTRLNLAAACLLGLAIVANPAATTPANAQGNAVAMETLRIANEGIVLDAAPRPRLAAPASAAPLGPDHLQKKHLSTIKHEPFGARPGLAGRLPAARR